MKEWNQCKQLPNGQWLDTKTNITFGNHFTYFTKPKEYSFLDTPDSFMDNPIWGKRYLSKYFFEAFLPNKGFIASKEMFADPLIAGTYLTGKDIMIVGAGPSAIEVDWHNIKTDLLWSCNHFFLNPILAKKQVDLFAVGNEVDLQHPELRSYLDRFPKSIACFETTNRPIGQIKKFKEERPEQTAWMHTRYRSQIGAIPRLIVLAALSNAKKVYFVGMDGLPTPKTKHAFQPGKKPQGSPAFSGAEDKFRRQFVLLWDYILHYLKPETEFVNLGENTEGNMTANISKQEFSSKHKH